MDLNAQTSTTTKSLCLKGHRCTCGSMLLWSETSKEQWFKCSRLWVIQEAAHSAFRLSEPSLTVRRVVSGPDARGQRD